MSIERNSEQHRGMRGSGGYTTIGEYRDSLQRMIDNYNSQDTLRLADILNRDRMEEEIREINTSILFLGRDYSLIDWFRSR